MQTFWNKVSDWCENHINLSLRQLTMKDMILGQALDRGSLASQKTINWILLTGKYYLQKRKLFFRGEFSLLRFLGELGTNSWLREWRACWKTSLINLQFGAGSWQALWPSSTLFGCGKPLLISLPSFPVERWGFMHILADLFGPLCQRVAA